MNEYEKAFVEHISKSGIEDADFPRLVREAYEAEFGGEGDVLLAGLSRETLADPRRFASEFYRQYGLGALRYFTMVVRYVDSGRFNPAEEAEEEAEESDLESIVEEIDSSSDHESKNDQAD